MCEDDLGPSYEWGGTEKYQDVWYGVGGPPENGVNVCFLAVNAGWFGGRAPLRVVVGGARCLDRRARRGCGGALPCGALAPLGVGWASWLRRRRWL